jgi:hypothetical protein
MRAHRWHPPAASRPGFDIGASLRGERYLNDGPTGYVKLWRRERACEAPEGDT